MNNALHAFTPAICEQDARKLSYDAICRSNPPPGGTINPSQADLNPCSILLALVLIFAWLLRSVLSCTIDGFIHILLVIAIVMILTSTIQDRKL
jgi:hypothetical protein